MAIQNRRGREVDFDPSKMLPGEWAVSLDTKYVRMCFAPGVCLRMATYEAFEADMEQIQAILAETKSIQSAIIRIQSEVNEKAALTIENAKSAEESAEIAHDEAERAKMYAENASAVTGIEIARKDRAGIIKGGENHIAEDGTLTLTKQTTDTTLANSYAGGIKLNKLGGASEQDGTPTPENPIEIKSVEVGEIKTEGKNLIPYPYDMTTTTSNGITWTDLGDGRVMANGTATADSPFNCQVRNDNKTPFILPVDTYILTGCPKGGSGSTYRILAGYTNPLTGGHVNLGADYGNGVTFTLTEECETTQIQLMVKEGTTVNNLIFKPMLRKADIEDDTFEPYKSSTASITFTGRAIEVSADDDYTYEKDGKYYIADTLERVDGGYKKVQRIKTIVFNGSEEWNSLTTSVLDRFSVKIDDIALIGSLNRAMNCSHFLPTSSNSEYGFWLNVSNSRVYIGYTEKGTTNLEQWKTWLEENNVTFDYILAEPIITKLSDEEAIALMSLKSFDTVTYITTDSEIEPVIDLEYGTSKVGSYTLEALNTAHRSEIKENANADRLTALEALTTEVTTEAEES